jgi:hypothetical protein
MSIKFDIKFNATGTLSDLKKMYQQVQALPQDAYKHFVSITPIDSGNARRSTRLQNKTIQANYPYARRLDEGWSKQAKNGMVKPTQEFIKKRIKQITGK